MNWLATGGHAVLSLCSGYGGLELAPAQGALAIWEGLNELG